VLLLSACGPERASTEQDSVTIATQEIAAAYQATQNLTEAQAQLGQLDVPNVNQWVLLTAESAIKRDGNSSETNALVKLSLDLGLQSTAIVDYARQNALLDNAANAVAAAPVDNAVTTNNNPIDAAIGNSANDVSNVIVPLATTGSLPPSSVAPTVEAQAEAPTAPLLESPAVTVTDAVAPLVPTVEAVEEVVATPTPTLPPTVRAASGINVRSGPGVEYGIAGAMTAGESAQILNKNPAGDWWEVVLPSGANGWVYGSLVEAAGDLSTISVASNIPAPPTPAPIPTQPPAAPVEAAPVEAAPVEAAPVEAPAEVPAEPAPGGPDFRVVEKRLWDVIENGGQLNGISVTCGEKRQLVVNVLDAAGNRLNGVAVQAIYGAQEVFVTGEQGKGDGAVEFVLGGGQALKVIRDADGREVSSEEVYNLSTKPWEIPYETLIGGRFCTDEASCKSFVDQTGCYGHYSWTVTFQRNY